MSARMYLEHLRRIKKISENTLRTYRSILREFQAFEPVSRSSWLRYLDHISKNAPKTQKLKLQVVKGYLNWKRKSGMIGSIPFWQEASPPKDRSLPRYLTRQELKRFFKAIDDPYYRELFRFLVNTGLRLSEYQVLKESDLEWLEDKVRIRIRGKGNKERVVILSRSVVLPALEAGIFSKKVSNRAIQKAMKRYLEKAGMDKEVSPHSLRHTFAIELIDRGVPLNKIQLILGHENISTTSIYLSITGKNVEIPELI